MAAKPVSAPTGAAPARHSFAVVFGRVVRGGDHRPGHGVFARVEIDQIGRHQTEIHHICADGGDPVHQCIEQCDRRLPTVPSYCDLVAVDQRHKGTADLPVQIRGQFPVVRAPAHVIGLEYGVGAHRRRSLGVGLSHAHFYTCARMRPTFSIVVPVYNEADFIPRAVPTLIEQMDGIGEPYRILIVENGSTDGTAAAAEPARGVR